MPDRLVRRRSLELAAAALANLLPVAGVLAWNWSLATLLVVYWLELGTLLCWATVRALLAQRPPAHDAEQLFVGATRYKRGRLSLPVVDASILVAHLPAIAVSAVFLGFLWLLLGLGVVRAAVSAVGDGVASGRFGRTVAIGAAGIFIAQGATTVAEYVVGDEAERVNAQMALQSALWPIAVVGLALALGSGFLLAGGSTAPVLAGVVGSKALFDLVGVYRDRLRAFDERTFLDFGWAYEPPEWSPVDGELSGPVETVRPRPAAVLAGGLLRGCLTPAIVVPVVLSVLGVLAFFSGGTRVAVLAWGLAGLVLVACMLVGVLHRSLRHLAMEYRVAGDVVGYDRVLGEPQWRVPAWKVARADPTETAVDRVFGTETLEITRDDRTIRLVHLADADAVEPSEPE